MEAIVPSGVPLTTLLEHGLSQKSVDRVIESGTETVEKLADMTPEQLLEIKGIGPKMVEKIQLAVNSFYSQFEEAVQLAEVAENEPATTLFNPEPTIDLIKFSWIIWFNLMGIDIL